MSGRWLESTRPTEGQAQNAITHMDVSNPSNARVKWKSWGTLSFISSKQERVCSGPVNSQCKGQARLSLASVLEGTVQARTLSHETKR